MIQEILLWRRLLDAFASLGQASKGSGTSVDGQHDESAASVSPKESQEAEKEAAEEKEVGLPSQLTKKICVGAFEGQKRRRRYRSAKKVIQERAQHWYQQTGKR